MNHIILADHDSATRSAQTLLLRRKLEADSMVSLIRTLADTPPDLLLLDWKLYESPALETCRLLQRASPELKIVLLSINVEDATAAKAAGATFIHKGASPDELITTLTPLLRKEDESARVVYRLPHK